MTYKNKTATIFIVLIFTVSMLAITQSAKSQQTSTYTAYGPIGTGPYIYMGTDPHTGAVKLVRNENYWNKDTLQSTGAFGIQELDLQYINGSSAVVAALKAGNVSVISPYYKLSEVTTLSTSGEDYVSAYAGDVFQVDINLQHPVFGTGVDTPLGKANASRAAEAALYVRQAISHLVPRQEIVDNVFDGIAMTGTISGMCPLTTGFDATIEPYSYNITLAKQLLTKAGYDTTSNKASLFNITLLVGANVEATKTTAHLVETNLNAAGIKANLVTMDFADLFNRLFPESLDMVGKSYNQGGFDAAFITYAFDKSSTPYGKYESSQFPPNGENDALWNNTESDRLCSLIKLTTNETERLVYLKQWQQLFYNEQPTIVIAYVKLAVAFDPETLEKTPFETYFPAIWPGAEHWVLKQATQQAKIAMAVTQPLPSVGFIFCLSGTSYDYEVSDEVLESLATQTNSAVIVPTLATNWEASADQTSWIVHLRQNVTWHDGEKFSATDVKFTYDTLMNKADNTWLTSILGSADNIKVVDEYTVKFTLPVADSNFESNILTYPMFPAHILQGVAYEDWATHPFNTAANNYTVSLTQATTATTYGFFDQYGIYIIALVIIVIIIATALILRQRNNHKTKNS